MHSYILCDLHIFIRHVKYWKCHSRYPHFFKTFHEIYTWFTQQFACGLHVIFCHKICNNCRMKNATKISALPKHKKFKVKMVLQFILITFQSLRESLWSRRVLICDYYYVKIVTTKQETTVKATKHQTLACLLVSCWKNYFFLYLLMYFHVVMYF